MITFNEIGLLKKAVIGILDFKEVGIDAIKETETNSIYLHTDLGVIRLSDHHNKLSADKCLVSIVVPVNSNYVERLFELL